MTLRFATVLRNHLLEAIELTCNGQTLSAGTGAGGSVSGTAAQPKLQIWSGASPANCAAAATGTKLVEITCPTDFYSAAANASKTLNGTWQATGLAAGTAGYYRIVSNDGTTCYEQGDIGSEMTLDNTSIAVGQTVTITSKTLNAPNP